MARLFITAMEIATTTALLMGLIQVFVHPAQSKMLGRKYQPAVRIIVMLRQPHGLPVLKNFQIQNIIVLITLALKKK